MKKRLVALSMMLLLVVPLLSGCELLPQKPGSRSAPDSQDTADTQLLLVAERDEHIILSAGQILDGDEVTMQVEMGVLGPTAMFSIGPDKPNGARVLGIVNAEGYSFLQDFSLPGLYDEYGDLLVDYHVQITAVDMDDDAGMEVLVSVGNKATVMQTVVYHYDEAAPTKFVVAGVIDGEIQMSVKGRKIKVPNTDPALATKYKYKDGTIELA